ncbi:tudor domain-containing protein 7A isoform X2 [Fundulus heteroclitus]|uniref:tudor domain-containing protein 7A isoform X2 n=1 Tax=Fundulus heteroclitus TaxID=8078 RepID=UPI00165C99FD|nr:tudor domain-containing protein 7A isoform X2 [Fundulus heteroclitus]
MSDTESVKKMLRAVLQSSKTGVSVNNLQSEYHSLCGEFIPLRKLGFSKLEDYLKSIPSVVKLENRMGELRCLAAVCAETAHIAELIARQRSSKKSGRSQVVNCKMRYKPFNPYMLNVFPQSSLRQPSAGNYSNWTANRSGPRGGHRGCSASGDFRQLDQKLRLVTPVEHRVSSPPPAAKENVTPEKIKQSPVSPVNKNPRGALNQVSVRSKPQIDLDPYDVALVQSRVKQLLERCPNGVWMSKLSDKYSDMFVQKLHPQALIDLDKWPHICMVEKACISNRGDQLIFPPLPSSSPASPVSSNNCSPVSRPNSTLVSSHPSASNQLSKTPSPSCKTPSPSSKTPSPSSKTPSPSSKTRDSPRSPLASPTFIFPPQSGAAASGKVLPSVTLRSPAPNPALAPRLPQGANHTVSAGEDGKSQTFPTIPPNRSAPLLAPTWTALASTNASSSSSSLQPDQDVLPLLKATFSSPSSSAPSPPSKPCPLVVSDEVRQKIKELLSKCSKGLWADALPRFFMDVYKTPFPEEILDNLCVLCDICTVEYPLPNNKKKAILYYSSEADMSLTNSEQTKTSPLPSGLDLLGPVIPPPLTRPQEHCPSVLVAEAKSTNALTIRYVGQNYSDAQEAMEDVMQTFYTKNSTSIPVCEPVVGQLVAVLGEDGDEVGRAQVMEVVNGNKVKVFYMDYGFSVETSRKCLLELHQDFLTLPFQATNVRLAGLEAFSCDPKVLSTLDKLAVGKILRMETLKPRQHNEMPTVVLYDTSEEDDVNVSSMCLKALQDNTMNNPLFENVLQDVFVSSMCADGSIICQLPSRGTARLKKLLEDVEAFLTSQVTSESLVCRPFSGKLCLARYKDKWARAEITYMHDNRVMEILFIDLGVTATVTFTEVREIPQHVLKEYIIIPPQTVKCQLADLTVPEEGWSQEALSLLKETVLGAKELKMKISKVEEIKGDKVIFVYLFDVGDSQELHQSINHQLVKSELWQKVSAQNNNTLTCRDNNIVDTDLTALMERWTLGNPVLNPLIKASSVPRGNVEDVALKSRREPLPLPPPLDLPQPGQNMDVFVPVACHPGYFIVQPWQDLHKLVVLMGEMVLYYNQNGNTSTTMHIQKGHIYAAKFNKNWHRVQLKGILANGLVSVYDLDYGEHELVPRTQIQPLIEEFRQLPFQALPAQLAGVTQRQWSEEASVLFRNHVEKRPLVAQVESVQDVPEAKGELRERKLTVYLVDTSSEKDVWIHSIMADIGDELSSAAEVSTQTAVE